MSKSIKRRRRILWTWIVGICIVNFALVLTLFYRSPAQNRPEVPSKPIKVRVDSNLSAPVRITFQYVDASDPSQQWIVVTVQNEGKLPITGLVLQALGETNKTEGVIVTSDYDSLPIESQHGVTERLPIDASSSSKEQSYTISLDLIIFRGGETWGADKNGRRQYLYVMKQGRIAAYTEIEKYLLQNGSNTDPANIKIPTLLSDPTKSEDWNRDFTMGYASALDYLKHWKSANPESELLLKVKQLREASAADIRGAR